MRETTDARASTIATRSHTWTLPAIPSRLSHGASAFTRRFESFGPLRLAVLQWVVSAIMTYVLLTTPILGDNRDLMNIVESYGALDRSALWQRALWWLPGGQADGQFLTLPKWLITWVFRLGLMGLFVLHAWAFWQALRGKGRSFLVWLIGPIGTHIIMLGIMPSNADLFFYQMSGDLAHNGINPYIHPLYEFPNHPILPYNHWVDLTTVYGPLWTSINSVIMGIVGPDPTMATLVYKILLGVVALLLAGLAHWLARHLTGNQTLAVAAGVLVAWQPNMILESSGQAHNDVVMLLFATAGLALTLVGGVPALRGGLILIAASATIKYVTLPLLGLLALVRLVQRRQRGGLWRVLGEWTLDGVAILAVLVATFLPYWAGFDTLEEMISEPGRLFPHPLWLVFYSALNLAFPEAVANGFRTAIRVILQAATFALLAWATWTFIKTLWLGNPQEPVVVDGNAQPSRPSEHPSWIGPLLTVWTVVVTTLSLVPANAHAWYWTWPVVPIALLTTWNLKDRTVEAAETALPRWFWWYLIVTAVLTLAYHTRIIRY